MIRRPLCPSDVSVAVLLELFVSCGREQNVEFSLNPVMPMQVLCFLQDIIHDTGCLIFKTEGDFIAHLEDYIGQDTDFVARLLKSTMCESADDLLSIVDNLSSATDVSPNGAVSPTMISADSYLGVYLRSFMVAMENMAFESACNLFTDIQAYKGIKTSTGIYSNIGSLSGTIEMLPASAILQDAQDYVMRSDFHRAEELVHDFFDLHQPSAVIGDALAESNGSSSLISGPSGARRHQHAMINMASIAVQTGNFRQALTGVEEAMKIAHQRGDHASVAQALLILYYVIIGMESGQKGTRNLEGNVFSVTPQSVLIRCLSQCVSIKMHQLSVQATMLFAKHLFDNGFLNIQNNTTDLSSFDADDPPVPHNVSDLWLLLLAASSDDFAVLENMLKKFGIHATDASKVGSIPYIEEPLAPSEKSLSKAQLAYTSAKMWMRLGFSGMAELQCRRLIRQVCHSQHCIKPSVLGDVLAMTFAMSSIICATSLSMPRGSASNVVGMKLTNIRKICHAAATRLKSSCSHTAQKEIDSTTQLISMLNCARVHESIKLCKEYLAMHMLVDQCKGIVTPAAVRGELLLALFTSLSDADTALSMLQSIEEKAIAGGIFDGKEMAMICRAVILRFLDVAYPGENLTLSLLLMEDAITPRKIKSREGSSVVGYRIISASPVVEGAVTVILEKFIRNESLQQILEYLIPTFCLICL